MMISIFKVARTDDFRYPNNRLRSVTKAITQRSLSYLLSSLPSLNVVQDAKAEQFSR